MANQKKRKKSGNVNGMLWVILVLTVLATLTVIGSVAMLLLDTAKEPTPPASSGISETSGSTEPSESSGTSGTAASSEPSESPQTSEPSKSSEAVSSESGEPSEASEKTSQKTSEKTSEKKNPSGEGATYTPFRPSEKLVAFTFDDGPYDKVTNVILDKIEGTGDHVTFFVVGDRVPDYPATVKRAVELGCEIGGHSYHHSYLTKLSENELQEELRLTDEAVYKASGADVSILRPPGGYYDKDKDYGYPLVMWAVDTEDWRKNSNYNMGTMSREEAIDAVYNEIINNVYSGCTVLLHDLYSISAEAFCRAYDTLKAQGYRFVTVSEMLGIEGRDLKPYVFFGTNSVYLYGKKVEN